MSAGCIPDVDDRVEAFQRFRMAVYKAQDILSGINHPDDDPRAVASAWGAIMEAGGQRTDWSIDTSEPLGITDLMEHYFL